MTRSLKRALKSLRYNPMNPSWEIAEFEHHPHGWPHARRCILARRLTEESDPEPTLFTMGRYVYRAWHTKLPLTPAAIWHFHDGRAGMERRIREIRADYARNKDSESSFCGQCPVSGSDSAGLQPSHRFSADLSPGGWQSFTLGKLLHRLFWLPGELTRPQNRPTLRLVNSPLIAVWATDFNIDSGTGSFVDIIGNKIHDIGKICTDTTNGQNGIFNTNNITVEPNIIYKIGTFAPGESGCNPAEPYYKNYDHGSYICSRVNSTVQDNIFYNNVKGWSIQVYPSSSTGC